MKYALVNGERQEAQPGLKGECPCCGSILVAKCGDIKVHHWSHHGVRKCDPWWENETEWHRNWKSHFPKEWQEVIQYAEDGEKHIADVKIEQGYVIEFQHSPINVEECQAREDFYKKMIWIIDGTRRHRDKNKFFSELGERRGDDRIVEIPPPLIPILNELKLQSFDRAFVLPRLATWDSGYQADDLRTFLDVMGLPSVRFHDLRATWATLMLSCGVQAINVMAMGGWKDMKTMMIYTRKAGLDIKGCTDNFKVHDHVKTGGKVFSLERMS